MDNLNKLVECRSCDLSKKTGFQLRLKEVFSETSIDKKNQIFQITAGKKTTDAKEVILKSVFQLFFIQKMKNTIFI